uniref:Uncharacterized protein n=1 Tax=Anguilla anguilla TaxID=7936 RepID=A0A0E9U476_ANGAN
MKLVLTHVKCKMRQIPYLICSTLWRCCLAEVYNSLQGCFPNQRRPTKLASIGVLRFALLMNRFFKNTSPTPHSSLRPETAHGPKDSYSACSQPCTELTSTHNA